MNAETRIPALSVIDAILVNANFRKGPRTTYQGAAWLKLVSASVDPVAIDYWAGKHLLIQAASLKGYRDLSRFDPNNIDPGSFGDWLRLSMEEIRKADYDVTANPDQMNVYTMNL